MAHELVINYATCSICGRTPHEGCRCREVPDPYHCSDPDYLCERCKAMIHNTAPDNDYLPLPSQMTGEENVQRLLVSNDDDGPLVPPTIDWAEEVAARQRLRELIDGPCTNCPDESQDYLPLPRL